jgi:NTE family protein
MWICSIPSAAICLLVRVRAGSTLNTNHSFPISRTCGEVLTQLNTYFYYGINSLNQKIYPTKGLLLDFEAGFIYNQHPGIKVSFGGVEQNLDSLGVNFRDYQRFVLNMKYYIPMGRKSALELDGNAAYNLHYSESVVNGYVVGGMTNVAR